jgi:subtilase family serine protease
MGQSSGTNASAGRRERQKNQPYLKRFAVYSAEALERRCLLSAGDANLAPSQAAILAAVSSMMQGRFAGSALELSPAPIANGATPEYVVLDRNPSLTAGETLAPFSSSAPSGYTPAQVRHAYGIDNIKFGSVTGDGTGQTIAIIDPYDDPNAAADLQAFDQQFGLPGPSSFKKVNQTGGSKLPGVDPAGNWELEESLDIEWAHAIAPAAGIILVEAKSALQTDLISAAVGWARAAAGVTAVSMSFGEPENGGLTSLDSLFTTPSKHAGVTFLASTGDNGPPGGYPAYSPNVVAVGGTKLGIDSAGNYLGELGWASGGGGISSVEPQPVYQKGVVTQTSTNRAIPDVAFNADPATGVAVCDSYNYGSAAPWVMVGGTSLSAPCWSGLVVIADQGRALDGAGSLDGATQTLPRLYSILASNFHDITDGYNGFSAQPGYDLVTGRGTPVAATLVSYLSAGGPYVASSAPVGLQSAAPVSVTFNFSTAMDPTSFSLGGDVDAFTGPGGADQRPTLTGYSWLNGNTTLQVNFAPLSAQGPYSMTIGPQVQSAAGTAMDQNQNGVNGEATADQYRATFNYDATPTRVSFTSPAAGSNYN